MLEFKNVTIKYNNDLVDKKYQIKKKKLYASCSLLALLCVIELIIIPILIKSAWCIPSCVISIFATIFFGLYIASNMIYSESDNALLYDHICRLRSTDDIYANYYDGRILVRVKDGGTNYYSLNFFTDISGITEEIIDESNDSYNIKLLVEYSFNKVLITIKEA